MPVSVDKTDLLKLTALGSTPMPSKLISSGVLSPVCTRERVADSRPIWVGAKVTDTEVDSPGFKVMIELCPKSTTNGADEGAIDARAGSMSIGASSLLVRSKPSCVEFPADKVPKNSSLVEGANGNKLVDRISMPLIAGLSLTRAKSMSRLLSLLTTKDFMTPRYPPTSANTS